MISHRPAKFWVAAGVFWMLGAVLAAYGQTITTVAGNGTATYAGDGGTATSASLKAPARVFVDNAGNIYIGDSDNQRVRKVDTAGNITTVAGNGTAGYSGDGGAATSAMLNYPRGVFVDGSGNLYIAEDANQRIRKVNTSGTISTVAGNGTAGYSGDGGAATSAQINEPIGIFVDLAGNLYIAARSNHAVRKVSTSGNISTVAGNGTQGFSGDGGAATSANLNGPLSVVVDPAGNLYIVDGGNHRVRKVSTSGTITTIAGNGTAGYSGDGGAATSAMLNFPNGLAIDAGGNLYIADQGNHRIRKVDTTGNISTVAGNGTQGFAGDGGTATDANLNTPQGVWVDGGGNLYIADGSNHRVRKVVAPNLQVSGKIASYSTRDGNREVYVMNPDGTGQTRLTNNSAADDAPCLSPDGTKIVFHSTRDGNDEIYVMNVDGSGQTRLTNNSALDGIPSWSADGTKILFYSNRDGNGEIYVMNADGSSQTRLTNNSADDMALRGAWSPDGTKIVFHSNREGNYAIYTMNSDGSSPIRITSGANEAYPTWSPDGAKIAYTISSAASEIYTMNADGSNQTNLSNNGSDDLMSSWSPDGTKIAFASNRNGDYDVFVMNADGSSQTNLTNTPSGHEAEISWGEAFRRIGSASVGASVSRILTIENKGGSTLSVSNITSSDGQFTLSPTSFSVNAGSSQNVTVTFTPTSAGTKYSTLTISSNDPDAATAKLTVNGTGIGQFTEVASSAGVASSGIGRGVAWGDYDGDGDLDLYVPVTNAANRLYQNNGNGTFTEVGASAGVNDGGEGVGAIWGDYDGDGDLDLYLSNWNGANRLYKNNGNGTFTEVGASAGVNDSGNGTGVAWGDYDGDGDLDLYLGNQPGANRLYQNNGNGTFTEVGASAGVNDGGNAQGVAWGDYDNDGDLDLYLANSNQANRLYKNNGNGTFTELGASAGVDDSGDSRSAAWGDYDNDGDLDLYLANNGANRLYRNNGSGAFTEVGASAGVNDGGSGTGVAWGDYDKDGDLDLYVANYGSENRLYQNSGSGTFTEIGTNEGVADTGNGEGVAWGDYDGDGDLDLYLSNDGSANRLYKNNGNSNRWLVVKLAGTTSNKSGVGARVTVVAGSTRQRRDVDGGSGLYSQPSLPVEFGFGGTTTVDSLIVRWPNGTVQALTNVATNQVLTVTEPTAPTISLSSTSVSVGTVTKTSSGNATLTVTNSGGGTLSISNITSSNSQFTASPTNFNLSAGASQTVTVTFAPTKVGWEQGTLSIAHNAAGSPSTVTASGIGRVNPPSGVLSNTKISFLSTRDGNNEIYVMNADGSSPIRLTSNSVSEQAPSWSSDGTKIVFTSNRDGNTEIYTMNADGTTQTRLTNNSADDNHAAWSPDSMKIAFKSQRDNPNDEVYVINTDGSGTTRLTTTASGGSSVPSWAPDGTKIAFHSNRDGNNEIYAMNADGTGQTRLTNNGAIDSAPVWSPDGTKIAFTSNRDGNYEVYSMNADGTGQTRLTSNLVEEGSAAWSPDGTKIAFYSVRDGNPEIYSMNADGTSQTRLTSNTTDDYTPSWSSFNTTPTIPTISLSATSVSVSSAVTKGSSGTVTFTVTNSGGGTLSVSNITSSNSQFTASPTNFNLSAGASQTVTVTFMPTKVGWEQGTLSITHNAAGSPSAVAASGIGRVNPSSGNLATSTKIAFVSERDGNKEVYTMNVDGANQTRLTNNGAGDYHVSWSPDGAKMVFASDRDGNGEIYVMNSDGSGQTRLTNNSADEYRPFWSPDGAKIAFNSTRDGNDEIYVMNSDGAAQTRLTNNSASDHNPSWSPDGAKIAFNSTRDGNDEIYVMNSDGAAQTRLTNNSAVDSNPTWSPDGTKIAFYSLRDGNEEIYAMNADGTAQTRLTNNGASDLHPSWSPDGTKMTFSSTRDGNQEVYVMNADGTAQTRLTNNGAIDQHPAWSPFLSLAAGYSQSASSLFFGTINVGSSGQQTFTVSNIGTAALTISGITVSGTNATQFTVNPTSFSVNVGATPQTITVTFTPTGSPGSRSASLSIAHNASGSPASVSLSGTAQDVTGPAIPAGLAATPSNAQVTLSWTANTESDLSHYVVYRSTTNNFTPAAADSIARVNKPTATYTNTGLGSGTYYFKLAAVDSAGNKSPFSLQATAAITILVKAGDPNPSSLIFKGSASSSLAVTVSDSGNTSLIVTPTITGTDAAQFSVSPNAVATLAPQGVQSFTVTFNPSPASGNNRTATLNLAHNATNKTSPLTVALIGDVPPNAPIGLAAIPGNSQAVLSWTANSESDLSHYVVYRNTTNNFTPAAADSIARVNQPTISFTNTGLSAGIYYYKIKAVDTGGNKSGESNPAQAIIAPAIAVSQTALPFGSVQVNTSKVLTFTVGNGGTAALSVSSIALSGAGAGSFSVTPSSLSINPGEAARTLTVTYAPAAARKDTATLTLTHNAAPTSTSTALSLTGEGSSIPVPIPSPNPLVFGNVKVGQSKSLSLTVSNSSASAISVSGIVSNDPAFTVSPASLSLPANGNATATVTFAPTDRNAKSATLTLTYATATGTATVTASLTGQGLRSEIAVTPTDSLRFGDVKPGQRKELSLTLTNPGNDTLLVSGISASNSVFSVPSSPFTLLAGASRQLSVSYAPTAIRVDTGTVAISSNAANARNLKLGLVGRGTEAPILEIRPSGPLSFGTVRVDSARVGTVRVRNAGGDTLKVTELRGLQPPFSVSPLQVSPLLAGDSSLVRVRFAPTARGTFTDTLVVNSNGGVRELAVSGRGTRAEFSVPERLVFDPVPLGSTGELNLILTNVGDDTLLVTNILSSKPQRFAVSVANLLIPPNNAQGVSVRFAPVPASTGPDSAELTLTTNVGVRLVRVVGSTKAETKVGPKATLVPDTLVLGPVAVRAIIEGSVELRNEGGDTLRVNRIVVSPSVFRLVNTPQRQTVPPGGSAIIQVSFRPTVEGAVLGRLEVRSDAPGSPHRVVLIGKTPVLPPRIVLSPADTLKFGVVSVPPDQGELRPLTIRNEGAGLLKAVLHSESEEFVPQQADTIRIEAGQQQSTLVEFKPVQSGTRTANLRIVSNDPQTPLSALVMQGIGGGLRFEPPSIDFGSVLVGTSKDTTVMLINETANAVTLNLDMVGAGFSADPSASVRVDAGKRVPVRVRFEPIAELSFTAEMKVRDRNVSLLLAGKGVREKIQPPVGLSAALGTDQVTLTWIANTEPALSYYVVYRSRLDNFIPSRADSLGRVTRSLARFVDRRAPAGTSYYRLIAVDRSGNRSEPSEPAAVTLASSLPTVAPDSLAFGEVAVGTTETLSVIVANPGTSTLNLTSITVTGRDARQFVSASRAPLVVAAGGSRTLNVVFNPSAAGVKSAVLNIAHDKGAPLSVALSGTATAAPRDSIRVSSPSLVMDTTRVGASSQKTLQLSSTGQGSMVVSLQLSGSDASQFQVTPAQATLRSGQDQVVRVVFAPRSTGTKRATLTLTPSTGSPLTVALSGTATAAVSRDPLQISTTSLILGPTPVRGTSQKTLRLSNTGRSNVTVTLRIGGRNASQFRVSPPQATVRAGREQVVTVRFSPTTAGAKSATLTITPSVGSPIVVTLSGTARSATASGLRADQEQEEAAKPLGEEGLQPALGDNYPNPFNAQTLIPYQLAAPGRVKLMVYDMLGQKVKVLMDTQQESGRYQVHWDGRDDTGKAVASGVYFYRLETDSFMAVRRLLLVK